MIIRFSIIFLSLAFLPISDAVASNQSISYFPRLKRFFKGRSTLITGRPFIVEPILIAQKK